MYVFPLLNCLAESAQAVTTAKADYDKVKLTVATLTLTLWCAMQAYNY